MKHVISLVALLLVSVTVWAQIPGPSYGCETLPCCLNCYGQVWYDTVDVSENFVQFTIDTVNGTDLWNYGNSTKTSFLNEEGFVTDSINSYPINAKGILEYRMPRYYNDILLFEHKYDTDSLMDGGYVRVSCDNGENWFIAGTYEISNAMCSSGYMFYANYPSFPELGTPPTIQDTIPAFTGSSDWGWSAIQLADFAVYQANSNSKVAFSDSIYFQFVFESDSIDSGKDGWMIRNIVQSQADIGGSVGDNEMGGELSFYPNPSTSKIQIDFGTSSNDLTIKTYNSVGELVKAEKRHCQGLIDYELPEPGGVYLIQLVYTGGKISYLKVVKE